MNWSDEPWIKLYTRDTVGYKLLPWQSKVLISVIMRKLDRAGVMDIGEYYATDAVSVMIDVPVDVVSVGLEPLLKSGVFEVVGCTLVCPNFIEAQGAKQSDKARQQVSRQRRRDQAIRDEQSQNVTDGHELSHVVTNRIELNRIELNRIEKTDTRVCDLSDGKEWLKVIKTCWKITGQQGDSHYFQGAAESILRAAKQIDEQSPMQVIERAARAWWADEWVSNKRPTIEHLAKYFDRYANVGKDSPQEEFASIKTEYFRLQRELKTAKSTCTIRQIDALQKQYDKASITYTTHKLYKQPQRRIG